MNPPPTQGMRTKPQTQLDRKPPSVSIDGNRDMRSDARSVQLCVSTIVVGSYHIAENTQAPLTVQLSVS